MKSFFENKKYSTYLLLLLMMSVIFISLYPVISEYYIRQDDMKWQLPLDFTYKDHYEYYNAVFQLVRPISFVVFFLTDKATFYFENAIYIRGLSISIVLLISLILYSWCMRFTQDKILSASYSACFCTLPAIQIFTATANYTHMLFTLLISIISVFLVSNSKRNIKILGCLIFFIGLLDYPLSSMIVFSLLFIAVSESDENNIKLFFTTMLIFLSIIFIYLIFIEIFHWYFTVDTSGGRSAEINSNIIQSIYKIIKVYLLHSSLWFWSSDSNYIPFFIITGFFMYFIHKYNYFTKGPKYLYLKKIFFLGMLGVLAYLPALALSDFPLNFRYSIATMPIILFMLLWSIHISLKLISLKFSLNTSMFKVCLLLMIVIIGSSQSYINLNDRIVKPHANVFKYNIDSLSRNFKKYNKNNKKVLIVSYWEEEGNYNGYSARDFEYGMRIYQYSDQVISSIAHSLRKMGYYYDFSKNEIYRSEREISIIAPFGKILILNNKFSDHNMSKYNTYEIITINNLKGKYYDE